MYAVTPFNRPRPFASVASSRFGAAQAGFQLPLQSSLVPIRANGSATPTFTRTTAAHQTDFEGKLNLVPSGAVRMQGARYVRNLLPAANADLTTGWTKTSATVTTGISDPLGGTTAVTVTSTDGASFAYFKTITATGPTYVVSFYARRRTGTSAVKAFTVAGASGITLSLTSTWQRFATDVGTGSVGGTVVSVGIESLATGDEIDFWFPQPEDVTGMTNQNPSEPVSIGVLSAPYHGAGVDGLAYKLTLNGNTVASNVITEATGAAITSAAAEAAGGVTAGVVDAYGPLGYLAEGARTNLALQSQTLTTDGAGAPWFNTNVTATADQSVAPDGTTTMDKFVEAGAGSVPHRISQAISSTLGATHTASIYVKDIDRRYVSLSVNEAANTNNWFAAKFDLTLGTVSGTGAGTSGTYTSSTITALPGSIYRLTVTGLVAGSGAGSHNILCGLASDGTTLTAAARGSQEYDRGAGTLGVYMWGAQLEAASFASTYITTTTVAVTRNASVDQYVSAGNVPTNNFTLYGESAFPVVPTAASYYLWGTYVDANNSTSVLWDGTNLIARRRIGGVSNDATIALTPTAATVFKWAATFSSSTGTQVYLNGTAGTADATNTACQIGTNFQISADGNGANQPSATSRNQRIYNQVLSAAQSIAMTT